MTEPRPETEPDNDIVGELQAKIDRLEYESQQSRQLADQRLVMAELKIEAIRAGMVDLDGLRLADTNQIHLDENGELIGGVDLINDLKRHKPWLFAVRSSSSLAKAPPLRPTRVKLATEMTDEEYRLAKAAIVKGSIF